MSAAVLENGVYLGLPKQTYFDQPRLGSTDLVKLLTNKGADWWYASKRTNPHWQPPERTVEMDFGEALHRYVLEGREHYANTTAIRPQTYTSDTGEVKPWHASAKPCIRFNEVAKLNGHMVITEDQHRRIEHMALLILNHPSYRDVLRQGLPEITVFFDLDGEPMRARFDYLLPRFLIDLKTYGGHVRGRDARDKATRIVAERSYDVQRFLYDWAREALIELVRMGAVFGATQDQHRWLERLAQERDWSWVWLFYQRRDDRAGRAPIVQPVERPRFDVTFDTGRRKAELALSHYRAMRWSFGDDPWALIEPVWRPQDHDFPHWLSDIPDAPANDNFQDQEEGAA